MSQPAPRNKLIIYYHKGVTKSHPEKGYVVRKVSKNNEKKSQPLRHGKSGGAIPHDYQYGKVESRRCNSLKEAQAIELFDNAVKKAIYYDENRQWHQIEIKPAKKISGKVEDLKFNSK